MASRIIDEINWKRQENPYFKELMYYRIPK